MTTSEKLKSRHIGIKEKLLSVKSTLSGNILDACKYIGDNLGVSAQTVYNNLQGRTKDGYLAEAIIEEVKKYKHKK